MVDAPIALQAISTVFGGLKTISDLISSNKKNEAALAIAEVQTKLGGLSAQFMEISQSNLVLSKENEELKAKLEFKQKLVFKKPFFMTEAGEGPYCPRCWDDEKKAIHLDGPHSGGFKSWNCPKCEKHFKENPDYRPPQAHRGYDPLG